MANEREREIMKEGSEWGGDKRGAGEMRGAVRAKKVKSSKGFAFPRLIFIRITNAITYYIIYTAHTYCPISNTLYCLLYNIYC